MRPDQFNCDHHNGFPGGTTPAHSASRTADKGFIDFDTTTESFLIPSAHSDPESMQHGPGGLVAPQTQRALELQSGHPILRSRHPPHGLEPYGQRRARKSEQCPRCRRNSPPTIRAAPSVTHLPPGRTLTKRADETSIGPPQPVQIVQTGLIVAKPCKKIRVSSRIIPSRCWHTRTLRRGAAKWIALFCLVVFRGRPSICECDGKRVQYRLPPHCPPCSPRRSRRSAYAPTPPGR